MVTRAKPGQVTKTLITYIFKGTSFPGDGFRSQVAVRKPSANIESIVLRVQ